MNISLEQRFHELELHYAEATTLLHLQGTLILDLQVITIWGYFVRISSLFFVMNVSKSVFECWLLFVFMFRTNYII